MVRSSTKYISSTTSEESKCGEETTPLNLEGKQGQQINISMLDFNWKPESGGEQSFHHHKCPVRYGYIIDTDDNAVIDLCGGTKREKHVYLSKGSSLQIVITTDVNTRFMLSYNGNITIKSVL